MGCGDVLDAEDLGVDNGTLSWLRPLLKRIKDELLAVFAKSELLRFAALLLCLMVYYFVAGSDLFVVVVVVARAATGLQLL